MSICSGREFQRAQSFLKELEDFCGSDDLALDGLPAKIDKIPWNQFAIDQSSFLHCACFNSNVTLEIVEYLLYFKPDAACISTDLFGTKVYPLHLACFNEDCDDSIIKLLMKNNPSALHHLCTVEAEDTQMHRVGCRQGLPLHYYLCRSANRSIATAKILVDAYPEALIPDNCESGWTPSSMQTYCVILLNLLLK